MRKLVQIFILYLASFSVVAGKPDNMVDVLFITVCGVPSIVFVNDRKTKKIYVMPIAKFVIDKRYAELYGRVVRTPRNKIEQVDAAMWTNPKHQCGKVI